MTKFKQLLIPSLLLIACAAAAWAAGATMIMTQFTPREASIVEKFFVDWVSDDVSGRSLGDTVPINGFIGRIVTVPGIGPLAPLPNYDIVLRDQNGIDILHQFNVNLENLSATDAQEFLPMLMSVGPHAIRPCLFDRVSVTVSDAGSGTRGRVILYIIKR